MLVFELYERAVDHLMNQRYGDAIKIYSGLLENENLPENIKANIYNDLGVIDYLNNNIQGAEEWFKEAIFTYPLLVEPHKNLVLINSNRVKRKDYRFSILLPTYRRCSELKNCISALREHSFFPLEIVVVADPSGDGTEEYLLEQSDSEDMKVIINKKRLGSTRCLNIAFENATGDYITIFNDDVIVMPGWDLSIVSTIEKDSNAGCGVPLVINSNGMVVSAGKYNPFESSRYDFIGKFADVDDEYIKNRTLEHFPEFQSPRECDYGEFPVFKRECIEKIGYVDLNYKHYFVDPDFGYRVQKAGYKNIYCPTSVVIHLFMATKEVTLKRRWWEDELYFARKWALTINGGSYETLFRNGYEKLKKEGRIP